MGKIKLPPFKLCYVVTAIRICDTGGRKDAKEENPETGPHKYAQLVFDKNVKAIKRREHSLFQQMVLEQRDIHRREREKKRPKSQNLGKNTGKSLQDLG